MSFQSSIDKSLTPAGTSVGTADFLPSLPLDQEDEGETAMLGVDLLYKMDIDDIKALRKHFFDEAKIKKQEVKDPSTNMIHGLSLNKIDFIKALDSVAGNAMLSTCAAKLFDTLDIDNSGTLQWEEVLDAIIEKTGTPRDQIDTSWQPIDSRMDIHSVPHCRREMVVKIVPLETDSTFCYAVISKLGRVGVYSGDFQLLDSYKIGLKPDEEATRDFNEFDVGAKDEEQHRRSPSTWVTDAIFVPDTYALLFSSSDRSLHLYDATGLVHVPLCRIIGMNNVPTCMDYFSNPNANKASLLLVGDDHGDVTLFRFHQSRTTLFKKKHPDKLDNFYWVELQDQKDYVTYSIHSAVHRDVVRQVAYCADNETFLSCSYDPVVTLSIRHIDSRRAPYIFKVSRGVRCFTLDRHLHILVTGSNDGAVRIWNPVVTKQPMVTLYGHKTGIVDLRVIRHMAAIVSLSKEGVVKLWDIHDQYCQTTLHVDFPVFGVLGKKIEYGARSIYPGPSTISEESEFQQHKKENEKQDEAEDGMEEIETQVSAMDLRASEPEEWNRNSIVVACCNLVAVLRLNPLVIDVDVSIEPEGVVSGAQRPLPPPAKEHYASVPSPWRTADAQTRTPDSSDGTISTNKSSSSSSKKTTPPRTTAKKQVSQKPDVVKSPIKNMNTKRTQYRIKQEQMKMLVEQCAPHLALDLHELEPIKFSRPLPVTRRMREKGIDVSDPERLLRARIQRDSTIMSLGVASVTNSSSPVSVRSSRSSKTASLKKKTTSSKGRLTPDWFTDKIKSRPGSNSESSLVDNKSK